jgi:tetratricopeptide (TPR) repeat protein
MLSSPQALQLQARNEMAQGPADTTEPLFRNALKLDPRLPGVHLNLGRILQERRGDLDGADREYRAELGLRPGNAEAAWRFGSLLLKKGQGQEALPLLQQSDKLRPGMLDVLLDLGKAYLLQNRVEDAEKAFQRIVAINDSDELAGAAHFQLSQIYRKLGRTAEADKQIKRFRELTKSPKRQEPVSRLTSTERKFST